MLAALLFWLSADAPLASAQSAPSVPPEGAEPTQPEPTQDDSPGPQPGAQKPSAQKPSAQKPGEPAREAPAETDAAPTEPAADATPLASVRPGVAWDDEIQQIVSARYPKNVAQLRRLQEQVKAVVKYARPAVVGVQIGDAVGSGVIIDADGLVLTAGHVAMEPNQRVTYMFPDGKRARGVTLGLNKSIDSGMMRITDKGPWPHVAAAKAGDLETGEWVVALGQPNGYFRDRAPPVRLGRVLYQDDSVINTDCTLVGGDSGGPLFNLKGEVVGIHSRIGRRITSNFHVPISTYEFTRARLLAGEVWGGGIGDGPERVRSRPLLGVAGDPNKTPCRLTQVFPGMPAERAGIKPGDIVRKFGDDDVESFRDLGRLVLRQKPRAMITVTLERDGKPIEVKVRLAQAGVQFPGAPPLDSLFRPDPAVTFFSTTTDAGPARATSAAHSGEHTL